MKDRLISVMDRFKADYLELRHHSRRATRIKVVTGALEEANHMSLSGVAARALVNGAWGFSSTSACDTASLRRAASDAIKAARIAAAHKAHRIEALAEAEMARGRFVIKENGRLEDVGPEEKMEMVLAAEKEARSNRAVKSAICMYREIVDEKLILNTDGAEVELREARPEFIVGAIATMGGERAQAMESEAVAGGWKDLFERRSPSEMGETAARRASNLASARFLKGGRERVILDPSLVGLISHEAFGHTVEADFVLSGSAAKGKLGTRVASELVTLVDSGVPEQGGHPAGTLLVDDEGVRARRVGIIEQGVLSSYLFDRETAAIFDQEPRGNARAFEYTDEPIIRMRNTYIAPGDWKLDEMIEDTRRGYLLKGGLGGQADANAEFMFEAEEAHEIVKGELRALYRGAAISGNAFDVLMSVDGVSREFEFDMGAGYCGKMQPAKVDGGGGYLRCMALIGGRQG
ncbi:MAG: TldD/PmbA family protein [Candidatus Thermoplasmatota archaeon]